MAKKTAAKTAKKTAAKTAKKTKAIPYKKVSVKFVSFSFGATIPTQSFGNVTPRIEVTADSYEEARDFAIPKIEALYEKYAEVKPVYMGRITEEVKIATSIGKSPDRLNAAAIAVQQSNPIPKSEKSSDTSTAVSAPSTSSNTTTEAPRSEAVLKAEKAISLAMTEDATQTIQDQIERSIKINDADKPALYTLILKKRKELSSNL